MGHENFDRGDEARQFSDRSLGMVFATVFAIVSVLPLFSGEGPRPWALGVAASFMLAALAFPALLAPLSRLWFKLGMVLHKVVNPLVLGVMFFIVVTPIGLIMRALGKDFLRLKIDRQSPTYWIERDPPGPPPESLKDQF